MAKAKGIAFTDLLANSADTDLGPLQEKKAQLEGRRFRASLPRTTALSLDYVAQLFYYSVIISVIIVIRARRAAPMRFVTVRDLRLRARDVWRTLREGEEAVLTINGSPVAVLIGVREGGVEETIRAVRQVRAQAAVSRMRETAAQRGLDRLVEQEVDAEIQAARRERRS